MHTAVRLRLNELKSSLSHMVSVGSQQRFLFSLQNKNQTSVWHSQKRYVKNSRYGKSSGKPTRLSPKQVNPYFSLKLDMILIFGEKFAGNLDITIK